MNPKRFFDWLVTITVAVGLLTGPFAVPARSAPHPAAISDEMQTMVDDMPCCPDQQDHKSKDCGSCPIVALCMATALPLRAGPGTLLHRLSSRSLFAIPDDPSIDGLGQHPPDHPPRTTV